MCASSVEAAYETELRVVKYGDKKIATLKQNQPESYVQFDSGSSMSWLSPKLHTIIVDNVSDFY